MYNNPDIFGLTGGMGSGKSTVSSELEVLGAEVIDADQIVRDLQYPGSKVVTEMAEILGPYILDDEGGLDRRLAGSVMFADESKRQSVMEMMRPFIAASIDESIQAADCIKPIVLDAPLLLETGLESITPAGVIVVETAPTIAVQRLIRHRGYTEAEAQQCIATQLSLAERRKKADFIIENNAGTKELKKNILAAWSWIQSRKTLGNTALKRTME